MRILEEAVKNWIKAVLYLRLKTSNMFLLAVRYTRPASSGTMVPEDRRWDLFSLTKCVTVLAVTTHVMHEFQPSHFCY